MVIGVSVDAGMRNFTEDTDVLANVGGDEHGDEGMSALTMEAERTAS